ncbi:hypothetical protein KPL76_06905 [Subtercola sp. PAMC28395]|uniref:hypothetical protein n=1 Tax=Subtercola sp. PAMC28395 TaxID=2846775 RepID=UPI001C0E1DC9|nr:hypothetical protein [Subtercola sp. PAMC28395]QWT25069.1 hypothetical protein KPL76_06905 [Subtercola sp. PAMC28395]
MTEQQSMPSEPGSGHPEPAVRRPVLLLVLTLVLFAEAVTVLGVGVWSLVQLVSSPPASYATAVALLVLIFAAGAWLLAIAVGTYRMRPWIRGAGITWQVLQIVVAVACFQGVLGEPADGWPLLIVAVVGIALLLSPSVVAVTRREV